MSLDKVPKVVFDTNVFVDVANGLMEKGPVQHRISPADWLSVVKYVDQNFLHAVSPITAVELLTGVAKGDERHFNENRVSLRKLRHSFHANVELPFTRYFIKREVFGMEGAYPAQLENDFGTVIDIVLFANSRKDLNEKSVRFKGKKAGIRFDKLLRERDLQESLWHSQAASIRSRSLVPTFQAWAISMLLEFKIPATMCNIQLVKERLDACFSWEQKCFQLARNPQCRFSNARNMLMDMNQLSYVAGLDILFVTRDDDVVKAVSHTSASSRVFLWDKFLELAKQDALVSIHGNT